MTKKTTKKDLINMVKEDVQQLYGQPDTAGDCLQSTKLGIFHYALNNGTNLNHNGYNNIFDRLMWANGILVGYKYLKTDDGKLRPIKVSDVQKITNEFLKIIK